MRSNQVDILGPWNGSGSNWLRVYLAISPLGTLLVTWLLVYSAGSGRWWSSRENLELAGQTVPLGGVIYGSAILVLEVSARMLWTLATRRRDMEKSRKEGREEGREETIQKLLERGIDLPPDVLKDIRDNGKN